MNIVREQLNGERLEQRDAIGILELHRERKVNNS
jgi:hypothetical protein